MSRALYLEYARRSPWNSKTRAEWLRLAGATESDIRKDQCKREGCSMSAPDYPIGTRYLSRGKHPHVCTVTDVWKTYNAAGELVHTRYVATHEFCGQTVTERDIVAVTIARGLIGEKA